MPRGRPTKKAMSPKKVASPKRIRTKAPQKTLRTRLDPTPNISDTEPDKSTAPPPENKPVQIKTVVHDVDSFLAGHTGRIFTLFILTLLIILVILISLSISGVIPFEHLTVSKNAHVKGDLTVDGQTNFGGIRRKTYSRRYDGPITLANTTASIGPINDFRFSEGHLIERIIYEHSGIAFAGGDVRLRTGTPNSCALDANPAGTIFTGFNAGGSIAAGFKGSFIAFQGAFSSTNNTMCIEFANSGTVLAANEFIIVYVTVLAIPNAPDLP